MLCLDGDGDEQFTLVLKVGAQSGEQASHAKYQTPQSSAGHQSEKVNTEEGTRTSILWGALYEREKVRELVSKV